MPRRRTPPIVPLALLAASLLAGPLAARAGCGCTKPPPPPAAVRPAFAWPGATITIFDPALEAGSVYWVVFQTPQWREQRAVEATAVARRDLADGVVRPQLVVTLPELPIGPVAIHVGDAASGASVRAIPDSELTVAPRPIGVPNGVGVYRFEGVRGAVSRDGTVLLGLDFGDIQHARVFEARALDLPLRFENEDLAFYNVQGFLMQLLGERMPGLYAIGAASGQESDLLRYSRHEFNTYFLQHGERSAHAVDPTDPNWHLDGTPHIDHDHQILAIDARDPGGAPLAPGATAPFTLEIRTETLFSQGVVGASELDVHNRARVRSYELGPGGEVVPGAQGHVFSNGRVSVTNDAVVHGDATAADFLVTGGGQITGARRPLEEPLEFLPVEVPAGLTDLGDLVVEGPLVLGVGSYRVEQLEVKENGDLFIDNAEGPVTLYVTEGLVLDHGGRIFTADADPEKLAIYLSEGIQAKLSDGAGFHGVVYGPGASVVVDNGGTFRGALVGADVELANDAELHYYAALHRNDCAPIPPELVVPADPTIAPGQLLLLPVPLADVLAGWQVRIGDRDLPLEPLGSLAGVLVPADLPTGAHVELALIDPNGCRSRRTVVAEVAAEAAPACGLLGIELAAVPLLGALLRRRRAGSSVG